MLRMDVPRRDPTATAALRLLSKQRELPRIPTLRRTTRGERLYATVAECLAAKGTKGRRRG